MAEDHQVYELPRESYSGEDSYTDYSSEYKDNTNHYGRQAKHYGEVLDVENEDIGYDDELLKPILLNEDIFEVPQLEATHRFNKVTVRIRDSRQKCLTLQEQQGSAHLVALFLQGNNLSKETNMKMSGLVSSLINGPTHKVALNIERSNFYLTCISEQDTPVLSLTEITDIEEKDENDLPPFLFNRSANTNNGKNTFESVAFPGWFICTSQAENQYVLMKAQSDQEHIKDFLLYDPK